MLSRKSKFVTDRHETFVMLFQALTSPSLGWLGAVTPFSCKIIILFLAPSLLKSPALERLDPDN